LGVPESPKSFAPRQLTRILWDFVYLCWANTREQRQKQKTANLHQAAVNVHREDFFVIPALAIRPGCYVTRMLEDALVKLNKPISAG
jgi:hypothetical protein